MGKTSPVYYHPRRDCYYTVDSGSGSENLLEEAVLAEAGTGDERCLNSKKKPDYDFIDKREDKDTDGDNVSIGFRFDDIEKSYWKAAKEGKVGNSHQKYLKKGKVVNDHQRNCEARSSSDYVSHDKKFSPRKKKQQILLDETEKQIEYTIEDNGENHVTACRLNAEKNGLDMALSKTPQIKFQHCKVQKAEKKIVSVKMGKKTPINYHPRRDCYFTVDSGSGSENLSEGAVMADAGTGEERCLNCEKKPDYDFIDRREDEDANDDRLSIGFRFENIEKSYWKAAKKGKLSSDHQRYLKKGKLANDHQRYYEAHSSSDCFSHDKKFSPGKKKQRILLDETEKQIEYTIKKNGEKHVKTCRLNAERNGFGEKHVKACRLNAERNGFENRFAKTSSDKIPKVQGSKNSKGNSSKTPKEESLKISQKQNHKSTKEQGSQTTKELMHSRVPHNKTENYEIQVMSSLEDVDGMNLEKDTQLFHFKAPNIQPGLQDTEDSYRMNGKMHEQNSLYVAEGYLRKIEGANNEALTVFQGMVPPLYIPRTKIDRQQKRQTKSYDRIKRSSTKILL